MGYSLQNRLRMSTYAFLYALGHSDFIVVRNVYLELEDLWSHFSDEQKRFIIRKILEYKLEQDKLEQEPLYYYNVWEYLTLKEK